VKSKRYLVTGGSGFIGSALVRRLVEEGHEVRVFDDQSRGPEESPGDVVNKIQLVKADIRDAAAVRDACRGIDSVWHLAFINGTEFFYTKPDLVLDVGVKGIVNVIDACIKENIGEIMLASSSEVYQTPLVVPTDESVGLSIPDPLNPRYSYAGGKIISELMAINYGRKYFKRVVIFRPHNVYGPSMGWEHVIPQFIVRMREIIKKENKKTVDFPIQGTGEETRAFVYIEDFIDGLMIMNRKGEHLGIYHIGTQDEITIKQVAVAIGRYYKKEIKIISEKAAAGGTPVRCPDISKMKALGYAPKYKFLDGLSQTIQWYENNLDRR